MLGERCLRVVNAVVASAVGFRNLCRCGRGELDHTSYGGGGGQNTHVLAVAVGGGGGSGGGGGGGGTVGQKLCRSASTRSFTFSTKL